MLPDSSQQDLGPSVLNPFGVRSRCLIMGTCLRLTGANRTEPQTVAQDLRSVPRPQRGHVPDGPKGHRRPDPSGVKDRRSQVQSGHLNGRHRPDPKVTEGAVLVLCHRLVRPSTLSGPVLGFLSFGATGVSLSPLGSSWLSQVIKMFFSF